MTADRLAVLALAAVALALAGWTLYVIVRAGPTEARWRYELDRLDDDYRLRR